VNDQSIAEAAAAEMYATDRHIRGLGIEVVAVGPGEAAATMIVGPEMVNGLELCHGSVIFTLADAALAYASNSHGGTVVAASASIEFITAAHVGDQLRAVATESHRAGRTGHYDVTVSHDDTLVALFKGRCREIIDDSVTP